MGQHQPKQAGDVNAVSGGKFRKMSARQKLRHVGKVIVFLLSFGFAFPNIFSE